jgi:hypothetical protein
MKNVFSWNAKAPLRQRQQSEGLRLMAFVRRVAQHELAHPDIFGQ